MKKYNVGIVGATGTVGQRFILLLKNHPWFNISVLAASERSSGKKYKDAVKGRWSMEVSIPKFVKDMNVLDAVADINKISNEVDFIFCAVNMNKKLVKDLEEAYVKAECPVISNNSANRFTFDVPMVIPEINPEHIQIIEAQKRRFNTKRGFIAVKSNCSLQCYVPVLHPLKIFGLEKVLISTYQAISGAGQTFSSWPEMRDNIIPYIPREESKSELEPLKIWGRIFEDRIINSQTPIITSQCIRVPVSDGHMTTVFASFKEKISIDKIKSIWKNFQGIPQKIFLPSAPKKFLNYFDDPKRPQIALDKDLEDGMAISIGRLREDALFDIKFVCMTHNTIRGAAGGSVLMAELLCAYGYFD